MSTFNHIRRTLTLSTTTLLMAANIVSAQENPMRAYQEANPVEGPAHVAMDSVASTPTADVAKTATTALAGAPMRVFTHTATASNTSAHVTYLDDPSVNGDPNARLVVTPNWNPPGHGGVYNNHPIGVWYDGSRWAIFNQDFGPMPVGASFNVRMGEATLHDSNFGNVSGNWTVVDNPASNNNPSELLTVTANWNPSGAPGVYHNHPLGVWYTGTRWAIFNEDFASFGNGSSFNVVFGSAYVHQSSAGNISGNYTLLDDPRLNGNPNAKVFATPNWNPNGVGGTYDDHAIGVWYTGTQWSVFNQDGVTMPAGAAFNVMVYNVPTITAAAVVGRKLRIDGTSFTNGATILINGVDRLTSASLATPTTTLFARRTLRDIPPGTTVTVQVRNADGLLSDPVSFTR